MNTRFTLLAATALFAGSALAADITLTPPAGGNVVIHAAPSTPALVVQPDQQVRLPGLPAAATHTDRVCHDASGNLGRCTADPAGSTVLTSDWFQATNVVAEVFDQSNVSKAMVSIPAFTATALDEYEIHVYMSFGPVVQLPYTSYAAGKVSTISYRLEPGELHIMRFTHDNSASIQLSTTLMYRYVMTPRGALAPEPTP